MEPCAKPVCAVDFVITYYILPYKHQSIVLFTLMCFQLIFFLQIYIIKSRVSYWNMSSSFILIMFNLIALTKRVYILIEYGRFVNDGM